MSSNALMADVVFCIDASASMRPCIEGVRANIQQFVSTIAESAQMPLDLRVDFLAYQCSQESGSGFHARLYSTNLAIMGIIEALYSEQSGGELFTTDISAFNHALGQVSVEGDECTLMALDTCLDFPWRQETGCRRIIILLTDEPVETGILLDQSKELLPQVIDKIQQLKVMLFMFSPESEIMVALDNTSRTVWEVVETGAGLGDVNLKKALEQMAKSISTSQTPLGVVPQVPKALFGQNEWIGAESRPLSGE